MVELAVAQLLRTYAGAGVTVAPATESVTVTEVLPKAVYTKLKNPGERPRNDSGSIGLIFTRWQIEVFAEKLAQASTITTNLTNGLDSYSGLVAGVKINSIEVIASYFGAGDRIEGLNKTTTRYTTEIKLVYRV